MKFIISSIKNSTFWTFLLLVALVCFIQLTIFQPFIQYRLNIREDWPFLIFYRTLHPDPLSQLWTVWTKYAGLHNTTHVYHIGILSEIFGYNYQYYPVANIVLKILATLSIFPVIIIIFKSRLLAFLTTILFSISSATAGPLRWITNGKDFIAVAALNIFFISYYQTIVSYSKRLLVLSTFLFFIVYLLSPPRMFSLLLLIPLFEIFWLLKTRKLSNVRYSLIRLIFFFLPAVLISIQAPVSTCCPVTSRPQMLLGDILSGHLFNFVDPLTSVGWSIFTNDYWKYFGELNILALTNFGNYLIFLIQGPLIVFFILTIILSIILSKKPSKFFIYVFSLNFILEISVFFLANRYPPLTSDATLHLLLLRYPTFITIYIFTIAFFSFLSCRKNELKDGISEAVWIGPLISIVFLLPMWVIMGRLINDWNSVNRYFLLPALGATLFMGAILTAFYERLKSKKLLKFVSLIIISIIIFNLYQTNKAAIQKEFMPESEPRVKISDRQLLHQKLMKKLAVLAPRGDLLIYFDFDESDLGAKYYNEALTLVDFGDVIHFLRGRETYGCIGGLSDKETLKKIIQVRSNEVGFEYGGKCVDKDTGTGGIREGPQPWFYTVDKFYAFSIKNGDFIDIKDQMLKELGI